MSPPACAASPSLAVPSAAAHSRRTPQATTGTRLKSEKQLPKGKYVGFHVRRKDKLVEKSISFHDMSPEVRNPSTPVSGWPAGRLAG